jgi:uncharacterized protein (TIGR02246 family)
MTHSGPDTHEACLERIRSAWDAGDARAYAKEFTEDATYVIFLGDPLVGRDEIEKNHVDVLAKWQEGTRMAVRVISARRLDNDVASVLTVGGIGRSGPILYDKLQTFTFVRRDSRWMCAAFQNTRMSRRAERASNLAGGAPRTWRLWRGWSRT